MVGYFTILEQKPTKQFRKKPRYSWNLMFYFFFSQQTYNNSDMIWPRAALASGACREMIY